MMKLYHLCLNTIPYVEYAHKYVKKGYKHILDISQDFIQITYIEKGELIIEGEEKSAGIAGHSFFIS